MRPGWHYEDLARRKGYTHICGVDEVGRGSLAGPVVAAAVMLDKRRSWEKVNDSKRLTPKMRRKLFETIIKESISWGIGLVEPEQIDKMNIRNATILAMKKAIQEMDIPPGFILIDAMKIEGLSCPSMSLIKGDQVSYSIAAASIVAKVYRDSLMEKLHPFYPQYHFRKNKGYGTQEHRRALKSHGPCEMHRLTFRSVLAE